MKRRDLIRHLMNHDCELVREGGSHSWWGNLKNNRRSSVPRHREIRDNLAKKICKDLGIPEPGESDEGGEQSLSAESR